MKRITVLFTCLVLLSGCATGVMVTRDTRPEITAKADAATLVIIRATWFGGAVAFRNYLDGRFIGETTGKTYFVTPVSPGPHYVVVATENTAVAKIDFQPGKVYSLHEGVLMGVFRTRTSGFEPLTHQQAAEYMRECTYQEMDAGKTAEDMDPERYKTAIAEYHADVERNPEGFKAMLDYRGY